MDEPVNARYAALPADVREIYPWPGHDLVLSSGPTLHYLDEGPRDAAPMVMVHGNPTWSFYWRELVRAFSHEFRCVVPDHVGSGLSDRPKSWGYHLQDHIDNVVELIDHLELDQITLVVHDWGGPIGLGAGVARHDRIARLVVFNTSVFMEHVPLAIRLCRLPGFGELVVQGLNAGVRGAMLRSMGHPRRLRGAVANGYLAPYRSWHQRSGHLRFFRDIPLEAGHPTRATIAQLTRGVPESLGNTPTQFIWGDRDFVFTPRFLDRWLELMPHAEAHHLEDAGHWVVEDAHERIVPLMADFVARTQA